jgi:cell division protein FtsN
MARDYKPRAAPAKKKQNKAVPGWVWFIGGLLVGLFFSGLAWLKLMPPAGQQVTVIQQAPATPAKQAKASEPAKPTEQESEPESAKPRFDFYTILPEMEVVVPDPEPEVKPQPKPQVQETRDNASQIATQMTPAAVTAADGYMLQMGSFRKYNDADRLKASLALIGMQAEIQKVTVNGGEVFHRVRSGPYSRDQVNKLRGKLKENNISSLVIKMKQ